MRTVREILKESDPQEIADILLRLHLNTLFGNVRAKRDFAGRAESRSL